MRYPCPQRKVLISLLYKGGELKNLCPIHSRAVMAENRVLTGYGETPEQIRNNPNFAIALMISNTVKDRFVPCREANKGKDLGAEKDKEK